VSLVVHHAVHCASVILCLHGDWQPIAVECISLTAKLSEILSTLYAVFVRRRRCRTAGRAPVGFARPADVRPIRAMRCCQLERCVASCLDFISWSIDHVTSPSSSWVKDFLPGRFPLGHFPPGYDKSKRENWNIFNPNPYSESNPKFISLVFFTFMYIFIHQVMVATKKKKIHTYKNKQ